ncbi:MAG: mechanosensitive ion channel domain-containing protein [Pseudomonadota bacterium]
MLTTIENYFLTHGMKIIYAIIFVLIGFIIAQSLKSLLSRAMKKSKWDKTVIVFVVKLIYGFVLLISIITALSQLGVPTTSMIAVLTAVAFAITYSLRNSLSHFAAGIILVSLRPVKVGDYIISGNIGGTVEAISLFYTTLRTPENQSILLPNGNVINNNITNYCSEDNRRTDIIVGVGYESDLDQVKSLLTDLLTRDKRVLTSPEPIVAVNELADSSVNMILRYWTKRAEFMTVKWALTENIKKTLDAHQINIPYPQRDVHLRKEG